MFNFFKKKEESATADYHVKSPLTGKVVALTQVPDPVFAGLMLGKGIAIEPTSGEVVSPVNGTVTTVFPTGHAIGLTADNGVEVLIHVGMDTVSLNGEGFTQHVKAGDKVKVGQQLVTVDLEAIKAAGYSIVTPIVITNTDNFSDITTTQDQEVSVGDDLLTIIK